MKKKENATKNIKNSTFELKRGIVVVKIKSWPIVQKAKTDCPIKWASIQG